MKLNSFSLAVMIFVLLFGGIGFTSAMNWWQTESTKVPATYTDGDLAGQYNPVDIRGSYTFGEVSELFDVPLEDLQAAFRLPAGADPASYPLKSLEAQFVDLPVEMGTGSVRMFVAFYKGLPYALSADEETYLFAEAVDVIKAQGKMTAEQSAYLDAHIVQDALVEDAVPTAAVPGSAAPETEEAESTPAATAVVKSEATPAPTEHAAPDQTVTGKTTFRDLMDWGVTQATIEGILGEAMPAPQTLIKDYMSQMGLEFSTMKTQFQAAVDVQK